MPPRLNLYSLPRLTVRGLAAAEAGTLRRAVRWSQSTIIPVERHMECAYYFA